jgi:hypothetical protein
VQGEQLLGRAEDPLLGGELLYRDGHARSRSLNQTLV